MKVKCSLSTHKNPNESATREDDLKAIREHEREFFYAVGLCVTEYQKVEDFLSDIFVKALNIEPKIGKTIFELYRGIETKLEAIGAVITVHHSSLESQWKTLQIRVTKAQANRNTIAHSTPTFVSARLILHMDDVDENGVGRLEYDKTSEPSHFRLIKRRKEHEVQWKLPALNSEIQLLRKLFRAEIVLSHKLEGRQPPEHLLADYDLL